jgi:hypothetical protein
LSHTLNCAARIKNELNNAVDNILVDSICKLIFYISHSKYPCYDCEAQIHIIYIFKATNTVPMKQRPRIINHVTIMNFQLVENEIREYVYKYNNTNNRLKSLL